jgi:FAD dependent oxidoreductase TIGR03364
MNKKHYDCIIIGAGVLGGFHAYHAAKKGLTVLLLEKDSQPTEATVRNFGMVIPSGMSQGKWQEYGLRSTEIYQDIQSQFDITVRNNGSAYIASDTTEMTLLEELATINEKRGYQSVITSKEDCLERYPGLRASYCVGGLFFPGEITVEPSRMIHHLIAYLQEQLKVAYRPLSQVKAVTYKSDRCFVETSDLETFTGNQVIICNGREFKSLYPRLFFSSDIEVSKLQMMRTSPMNDYILPGSVFSGLSIRRYESFAECPSYKKLAAATINEPCKKWGIHVLFKQATDGSMIIGDSHEYEDAKNADRLGFDIKQVINDIILEESQKMFRFPHWNIVKQWNGFYAQRKGHDLFMETVDTNTMVITAIGGKGMTASAALAEENIQKIFG